MQYAYCVSAVGVQHDVLTAWLQCDSFEQLVNFIATVASSGVTKFVIHARKAILGLNTKENRCMLPCLSVDCHFGLVDRPQS